ncbi:hypothetical protein D3C86_1281140 [compost metagenome]
MAIEEGAEHGRGNALRLQLTVGAHARHHDADLDRVEQAPARLQAGETVPFGARLELPAGRIGGQLLGIGVGEIDQFAALVMHLGGVPRLEEPVAAAGELAVNTRQRLAEIHRLADRVLGQAVAAVAIHHRRAHLVGGEHRIERRGAGLDHEGLVEAAVLDRVAAVADMDERGLRQRRQQLVSGVGGEHRRRVGLVLGRVAAHGEAPTIQRIEARVAVPGLVEVDTLAALRQQAFGAFGIQAHAVIGAVGHHRVDRLAALGLGP